MLRCRMTFPSRSLRRILAFFLASALLISAATFTTTHWLQRAASGEYAQRSALYATVILSSFGEGEPDPALVLFNPGILYARDLGGSSDGWDVRSTPFEDASLPAPPQDRLPESRIVRISGRLIADVVIPREPCVAIQIGVDASSLARTSGRISRVGALAASLAWLATSGIGAAVLLHRQRSRRSDASGAAPEILAQDAGRRIRAGVLLLSVDEQRLHVGQAVVDLTPKQTALFELLISQPGRAFSDHEILSAVWPDCTYATSSDVKQHIYLIRKRLAAASLPASDLLVTVPGRGYRIATRGLDRGIEGRSTE